MTRSQSARRRRRADFVAQKWRCNGYVDRLEITDSGARRTSDRCVRDATRRIGGKGYPYCDGKHESCIVATRPTFPFVHGDEIKPNGGRCACAACAPPAGAAAGGGGGPAPAPAASLGQAAQPGGQRAGPAWVGLAARLMPRDLTEDERRQIIRRYLEGFHGK